MRKKYTHLYCKINTFITIPSESKKKKMCEYKERALYLKAFYYFILCT